MEAARKRGRLQRRAESQQVAAGEAAERPAHAGWPEAG